VEKLDFIDSKFRFALLAAKRAKQIVNGSKKRIDMHAENPLTIALEEIYREKVNFKILDEEEMLARQQSLFKDSENERKAESVLFSKSINLTLDDDDDDEEDEEDNDDDDTDDLEDVDDVDDYDDSDDRDYDDRDDSDDDI